MLGWQALGRLANIALEGKQRLAFTLTLTKLCFWRGNCQPPASHDYTCKMNSAPKHHLISSPAQHTHKNEMYFFSHFQCDAL